MSDRVHLGYLVASYSKKSKYLPRIINKTVKFINMLIVITDYNVTDADTLHFV